MGINFTSGFVISINTKQGLTINFGNNLLKIVGLHICKWKPYDKLYALRHKYFGTIFDTAKGSYVCSSH